MKINLVTAKYIVSCLIENSLQLVFVCGSAITSRFLKYLHFGFCFSFMLFVAMSFHTSFFGVSWNVAFISEMNITFVETFGVYFMGYDQLCMHVMKNSYCH